MDILSVVTRVPILVFGVERHDDDFADRINYKYTVAVLVIFAIIVTNRQFGTKQIHCWIPAYFTRNYEEYINDICWVSNTYYISLDQKLPEAEQIRKNFELKYYQWVPFILLSQAFFFYIPHIAWRALSRRSGIDVRDIVEAASNYKSVDKYESRQKYMTYMLTAVDQYVDDPRRRKETRRSLLLLKRLLSGICCISGKFLGNYLMVLYLFIKLAFIGNCICQLFVLNLLLGHEFHKFGFELLDKIINGKGWDTGSKIFPKISMCDFRIREIGNPKVSHRYTVQCVLPINLFNQQIFTFIWFWYGLVLIINIYSLCVWTYRFLPSKRLRYVSRRIEIMRQALLWSNKQQRTQHSLSFEQIPDLQLHDFERDLIKHFVHDYLESDGLFILRVLSSNTSDFVCTELIQELWKYYRKQRKFNRSSEDDDNEDDLNDDESMEFKKSLEDFTDSHNINSSYGENKQQRNNANNMVPKRRMNNKSMPSGYVPGGGVGMAGGGGVGPGPRPKMVRTRKKPSSIQFKDNAENQQRQQQQKQQQQQETNEGMSSPPLDDSNLTTYNNDNNNHLTVHYDNNNNDTSNAPSDIEQERLQDSSTMNQSSSSDQQQPPPNDLVDSKENNNNAVDKDNEYNNNNQTGNNNGSSSSSSSSSTTHKSKPANGLMAVVQKNGSGRSSSKNNSNKPLSVISEQFSNIYSKSRKSPTSEKVAIVAMAQNAQIQRLKQVNRTTSLDPNLHHVTDRSSPQQLQLESSPENPSSNNEFDSSDQQQQQKRERVKLKRPTNFSRKLLDTDSKQQSDSSGGGVVNSPPRQSSPQPNQSPPQPPQSLLTADDVMATYTTTTTTTTNSEMILVEDELIVRNANKHHKHHHHHHHHESSSLDNDNRTTAAEEPNTSNNNNNDDSISKSSSIKSKYLETET